MPILTKNLKAELQSAFPNVKFSVRLGRKNGWVGQVINVEFDGELTTEELHTIYSVARLYEAQNFGCQVETNAATWNWKPTDWATRIVKVGA